MKITYKLITYVYISITAITLTKAANYGENAWFKFSTNLRKNNVVFNGDGIYITPNTLFTIPENDSVNYLKEHIVDDIKVFTKKTHVDVTNNTAYGNVYIVPTLYKFKTGNIKSIESFKYNPPVNFPNEIALEVEMRSSYKPDKVCKFTIYIAPKFVTVTFMNEEIALCDGAASLMSYNYHYSFANHILVMDDLTLKDNGQGSNTESFLEPATSCNSAQTVELNTSGTPSASLNLISGKLKIENDELKFYCKGHFKEHDEFDWKIAVPGLTLFTQESTAGSQYDKDFVLPPAPWKSLQQPNGMFLFTPDYSVNLQMKTRQSIMIMMR